MTYPLAPFLRPRSIALVGASDQAGKLGYALVRNLANFEGQIFYVNPKRPSILEQPTSPTVCAIGQPVDLAAVLVPIDLVEAAVDAIAHRLDETLKIQIGLAIQTYEGLPPVFDRTTSPESADSAMQLARIVTGNVKVRIIVAALLVVVFAGITSALLAGGTA